ncbi:MAG: GntR family transcriptional regulator [Actinomycetota bacterium]|nr:GntR family transcriptional regulator [Actinomycetota bacterium]
MVREGDSQSDRNPRRTGSDRSGSRRERFRPVEQLRQPRLAEMVASSLRNEILSGRLKDGDTLPRQEDLLADFKVSPPAVREALRILETEGLISVRRGNVGGAVVHFPTAHGVAYMVSLVLHAQRTSLHDVGAALRHLEPVCASMCAQRPDRADVVTPVLEQIMQEQLDSIHDVMRYNQAARAFHEALVAHCGNETMILVIGALESLWTAHERHVYEVSPEPNAVVRRTAVRAHEKLVAAIASGNAESAAQIARRHLDATQAFTMSADSNHDIDADLVRDGHLA